MPNESPIWKEQFPYPHHRIWLPIPSDASVQSQVSSAQQSTALAASSSGNDKANRSVDTSLPHEPSHCRDANSTGLSDREAVGDRPANSVAMCYVDVGPETPPDDGEAEVLLFVHGNPTWSFYWRKLIAGLSDTRRCIAVDHVGCGRSEKPQRYPYSLKQHITNLVMLVEQLDLRRVTLVAHDWGGAIGLGAVEQLTDRFERLVLLNTAAFSPPYIPWRIRACRMPVLGTVGLRGLNLFSRAALKMAVERSGSLDKGARAGLLAPYDNWHNRVAVNQFVRDIPASPSHPTWQVLDELEAGLDKLKHLPVQLIWGMKDWCFRPICMERFQQHFPDAESFPIEDAGHYVIEDAPELVLERLRTFLGQTAT